MSCHSQQFIAFAHQAQVLRFGEFTLKSGRISPYFFNAGLFQTGSLLATLGRFYAQCIVDANLEFDMLFGPAYKGIPLVSAVAISLATEFGQDYPYAFNRKTPKAHGEGGSLVGAPLQGNVLIVDDVITAGTAFREAKTIITDQGAKLAGIAVALDRQERGQGTLSAIQEIEKQHIQVLSIAKLTDLITYLHSTSLPELASLEAYRAEYGVE